MKNTIKAVIIADSISPQGHRITTYLLTYPRFIHSELMTHRMFSRNSASSRAIPFEKMVKMVEEDPFIPIAWQSKHTGMQGTDYLDGDSEQKLLINKWLEARDLAVQQAKLLDNSNVTKQLCNRLLEPYMWHTTLVTSTEFNHFFNLRCPKYHSPVDVHFLHKSKKDCIAAHSNPINLEKFDKFSIEEWLGINESQAEIHIQALAESMWDARNESIPKELKDGEWHIPFGDKLVPKEIDKFAWITNKDRNLSPVETEIAIATARCARLSYMTFDNEIDYEKDIELHDRLLADGHMSPFEHCARVMDDVEFESYHKGQFVPESDDIAEDIGMALSTNAFGWCNNFKGFIPYRYLIENK